MTRWSERAIRRLWFVVLWLTLPWPMIVFDSVWVPSVRYAVLGGVTSVVAISEGAAGPVMGLVALFCGQALVTAFVCWLIAFIAAKILVRLPDRPSMVLSLAIPAGLIVLALFFEPYLTPFGRAARGGLLDILS